MEHPKDPVTEVSGFHRYISDVVSERTVIAYCPTFRVRPFLYLIQYKFPLPKANNCHAFIYNQQLISSSDRILAANNQRGSFENRSRFDLKPS